MNMPASAAGLRMEKNAAPDNAYYRYASGLDPLDSALKAIDAADRKRTFDYSNAVVDDRIGNKGESRYAPGFKYYKGEPIHLRRKRFAEFFAKNRDALQAKLDKRTGVNGLDRFERWWNTPDQSAFGRSWVGRGLRGVGRSLYYPMATLGAILTNRDGATEDGLNRYLHNLANTGRGIGNMGLELYSLADRASPLSMLARKLGDRSLDFKGQDLAARKMHADISGKWNGWFDRLNSDLDMALHNKQVPKMSLGGINLQSAAEGLTEFGTEGAILGTVGKGISAINKANPVAAAASATGKASGVGMWNGLGNYFNGSWAIKDAPRVFHDAITDATNGNYGSAAENTLWGLAYSGLPVGRFLRGGQAALAAKSPLAARGLGTALFGVRHPFMGGTAVNIARERNDYLLGMKNMFRSLFPKRRAGSGSGAGGYGWVPYAAGAGASLVGAGLVGAGGYGLYKLLENRRRRREQELSGAMA